MNDLEETLDLLVQSVSVDWSVSEDEGAVEERLQLNCCVVVRPGSEGVLGPFTGRYREGWVTLMPLHGDHARNDKDQPVVGVLFQRDENICIRILVNPTYLAGLATLIRGHTGPPVSVSVSPYSKLSEWNGQGILELGRCDIAVGVIYGAE